MRNNCDQSSNDECGASPSGRYETSAPSREGSARAIALSKLPPLHWWRRLSADVFTGAHAHVIRRAVSGFAILNEPLWRKAAKGDPAAAIGIALRVARRRGTTAPVFDLVMSAVLLAALSGDPAAALTLATMIKSKGDKTEMAAIIATWLGTARNAGRSAATANSGNPDRLSRRAEKGA